MWYKNAVVYSLDVETFMDSDGDGVGDFRGLLDRIDHLESLGVTCVWLQPFFPSPNRDDGYDITDYYAVDSRLGSLGDFAECAYQFQQRGIRLILDLVVNHTSDQHPWFRAACADAQSPFRDFYLWSRDRPADADQGMVFPGEQNSTWTWNAQAGAYYFHRFYAHQPDLDIAHPAVREEILRIMGYWLRLGISGFRIDAAPFLIQVRDPARHQDRELYSFLRDMHDFCAWRARDAILLAEANVPSDKAPEYFGDGKRVHVMFNFPVNQPLFLALARRQAGPLAQALRDLPDPPKEGQWANFLRTHDELDLGRLTDAERREVFDAFGPDPGMQIFGRGIRRRLGPMFDGDLRRIHMAHSLVMSLPGMQVLRYGDEIGMGEDLSLPGRDAVRTPMQWSDEINGGFSTAPENCLIRPVISDGAFGYGRVNVQDQISDPDSVLNLLCRLIRLRRSCPEIGWGKTEVQDLGEPAVLAHCCRWGERQVMALHNLGEVPRRVRLPPDVAERRRLHPLIQDRVYEDPSPPELELGPFGFRWFRVAHGRRDESRDRMPP